MTTLTICFTTFSRRLPTQGEGSGKRQPSQIEFVVIDDLLDDGFTESLRGARALVHLASPLDRREDH